jgi:hypothetical protein
VKKLFNTKRKIAAVAISSAVILGASGAALAYFTTSGSGTGNGKVGSSTAFAVTVAGYTGGPIYPGSGSENATYTVTNPGPADQLLTSTSAALTTDVGGGVYDTTTAAFVDGCKASWFTVTNHQPTTPAEPATLHASGTATGGSVDLSMPSNSTDNQNACEGLTPQITVSATS